MGDEAAWLTSSPRTSIEVGGLLLRRWRHTDIDALYEAVMSSLPELQPWMPWAGDYDRGSARWFVEAVSAGWDERSDFQYALLDQEATVLGACGLHDRLEPGGLEIGYWVRSDHTGRGLATLAAAALTAEAVGLDRVSHVEIHHDRANVRSGLIPRRLGFRLVQTREDRVVAPGEEGVEQVWRLEAADHPASPARQLVEHGRPA